jgi:hypothetical protein
LIVEDFDQVSDLKVNYIDTNEKENQERNEENRIKSNQINSTKDIINQGEVILQYSRSAISHKRCLVCKQSFNSTKLFSVPLKSIIKVFLDHKLFIPIGSRCCASHLDEHMFLNSDSIKDIVVFSDNLKLSSQEVQIMFDSLRESAKTNSLFFKFANLEQLNDEECITNTGFNKSEFAYILNSLQKIKQSIYRNKSQALAIYLYWLKNYLCQENIAAIFGISQQDVSRYCSQIRDDLMSSFVSQHLGPQRLDRQSWIQHNSIIVKEFFFTKEDQFAIIADGTYCYCQKSSDNFFQRQTYSGQKKRHLVKPFVLCASDGTIIDVYGLYGANQNDASIFSHILKSDNHLLELLKPGDVVLLDRGFRDCISEIKNTYKLNPYYPSCNK